ncbi:MAG: Holliday junction branch migration protein RuvA [Luteitalea sp.]|nr:Holliday junction branch migration protein RuvA [Luteitalea sp.]
MIARLRGRLLDKHPNRALVDVQGVGYDVHVPLATFTRIGEQGDEVTLRVHTYVREDQITLFGFATALEQQIFERLIGISGVGPKLALAVLSGLNPVELVQAIERGDLARLTSIPGIGRKTAERIALELRDRLPIGIAVEAGAEEATTDAPGDRSLRTDLLSALTNLGYHRPLVEKAVARALENGGAELSFEQALKRALRELAR